MQNHSDDHEDAGFDVAEAAARAPGWISYYSLQQHQLQDPSYQYLDPGNTSGWYTAPSLMAETPGPSTATTHLGHDHTATPQTTMRSAHPPTPLYYSNAGFHGQNPAVAGTAAAAAVAYSTALAQQQGVDRYQAHSAVPLRPNSALPDGPLTSFAAYSGGARGQRPGNTNTSTISDSRMGSSRRARTSTRHRHRQQPPEPDYDHDYNGNGETHTHQLSQYLQVPTHTPLPATPTSPSSTSLSMPSPTPSSPASHTTTTTTTGFQPKQCNWDGCSSSTWFRTEAGLARHVRTIHIAPDAYPCVEPGCSMKFGRNDHLNAHRRNVHGF